MTTNTLKEKTNFMQKKIYAKDFFWWAALFFILLFFHIGYSNSSDDGVILEGAWNLINGRELYIDFFEFAPPGNFYFIFIIWKIFGVHYFAAKLSAIILFFFASIGIYKISQEISPNKYNYLPPLFFILSSFYWPLINHNTFNICILIWAVYFFAKGLSDKKSFNNIIISGFLCGISMLFIQQKGLMAVASLSSFLFLLFILKKNIYWLKSCLIFFIFSIIPILPIFLKWPADVLYKHLIEFPLSNYAETNIVSYNLLFLFLFFLVFNTIIIKNTKSKKIWFLAYLQLCLLVTTIPRADIFHISIAIFPLFAISPIVWNEAAKQKNIIKLIYAIFLSSALLLAVLPSFTYAPYIVNNNLNYFFSSHRENKIIEFVKNNCPKAEDVYAGAFIPQYYFTARKLNPTPYSWFITDHQTQEQFAEAAEILKQKKPKCAILNYQIVKKFNYNLDNPVDNFILNNYELEFSSGNTSVYTLK